MSQLPRTWRFVRLEEICEVNPRDKAPVKPTTKVSFVPMSAVSDIEGVILPHDSRSFSEVSKGYTRFRDGDVIFAKITPCMENGKIACAQELTGGIACGSTEFHVLRPGDAIESSYLWRFLRQDSFRKIAERQMTGAVGQRRVPAEFMKQCMIPLPPVHEQRSIVAKLETLFSRSRIARDELARVPRLIERYKQAILAAGFRGDLTTDWRRSKGLPLEVDVRLEIDQPYVQQFRSPANWIGQTIDSICDIVGGSQPPKTTFKYEAQDGYIRFVQIRDYKSDDRKTYIPVDLAKRFCAPDDIMIGRYGPPIFQILRGLEGAYNVALMKAVPKSGCSKEFLFHRLQDPELRRYVEMGSDRTAGQDGVNKSHLLKYPVFMPPPDEQNVIVERIKECFAAIERASSEVGRATRLVDRLDEAILAQAFSGELSSNDAEPFERSIDNVPNQHLGEMGAPSPNDTTRSNRGAGKSVNGIAASARRKARASAGRRGRG